MQSNKQPVCDTCKQRRTLNSAGICHQCNQKEIEASVIVDENGEEWTPGGYRL
jgi:tRNA(Ile2) C34 agmatinyltransferase TiaS